MRDSFQRLLADAQAGDESAMGKLFEQYRPFLLQIANEEIDPRLKRKVGGSDAVQQSMMEAGDSLHGFVGTTTMAFEAWLRRILLNNLANLRRHYNTDKRNVAREVELADTDSKANKIQALVAKTFDDSGSLSRQETLSQVAIALDQLSSTQRLVIQMRTQGKKSFQEIGEEIGKTADATRKIWARAIESLKTEIGE